MSISYKKLWQILIEKNIKIKVVISIENTASHVRVF